MMMMRFFIYFSLIVISESSFICPQRNGLFADPSSEKMFFHCIDSIASHKPCPAALIWSQFRQRCFPNGGGNEQLNGNSTTPVVTSPVTEVETNACSKENPCQNDGSCQPSGRDQFVCLCKENFSGTRCEFVDDGTDLTVLQNILNGTDENVEKVFPNVLQRNNWTEMAVVIDVTGSMQSCAASVYQWMRIETNSRKNVRFYVFFNDGDGKANANKTIGSTGGIYGSSGENFTQILETMQTSMKNGHGGDIPENDVEAILFAIENCPTCQNFLHLADNRATPRDLSLLTRVTKPIRVLTCQVDSNGVNPQLLNIADKTRGSLHTVDEDVVNLDSIALGGKITIGKQIYQRSSNGFVLV